MAFIHGRCLLKLRLKEIGKSQQWLAKKVDMPRQQISDYANDRYPMNIDNQKTIAAAIGCETDLIYLWIEIPSSERKRRRRAEE